MTETSTELEGKLGSIESKELRVLCDTFRTPSMNVTYSISGVVDSQSRRGMAGQEVEYSRNACVRLVAHESEVKSSPDTRLNNQIDDILRQGHYGNIYDVRQRLVENVKAVTLDVVADGAGDLPLREGQSLRIRTETYLDKHGCGTMFTARMEFRSDEEAGVPTTDLCHEVIRMLHKSICKHIMLQVEKTCREIDTLGRRNKLSHDTKWVVHALIDQARKRAKQVTEYDRRLQALQDELTRTEKLLAKFALEDQSPDDFAEVGADPRAYQRAKVILESEEFYDRYYSTGKPGGIKRSSSAHIQVFNEEEEAKLDELVGQQDEE